MGLLEGAENPVVAGGWVASCLVPRLVGGSLGTRLVAEWLKHESPGCWFESHPPIRNSLSLRGVHLAPPKISKCIIEGLIHLK